MVPERRFNQKKNKIVRKMFVAFPSGRHLEFLGKGKTKQKKRVYQVSKWKTHKALTSDQHMRDKVKSFEKEIKEYVGPKAKI